MAVRSPSTCPCGRSAWARLPTSRGRSRGRLRDPVCVRRARLAWATHLYECRVGLVPLPHASAGLAPARRALRWRSCPRVTAAIFARAHAPERRRPAGGVRPAASAGGDRRGGGGAAWDDAAFERAYADPFDVGSRRLYAAVAPVVGLSLGAPVDLGDGIRIRAAAAADGSAARRGALLASMQFGRRPTASPHPRAGARARHGGLELPDAPGELEDAVTRARPDLGPDRGGARALRRRLSGLTAFGRCCGGGNRSRGDPVQWMSTRRCCRNSGASCRSRTTTASSVRRSTASRSPCSNEPFRSEQLRMALEALLGAATGSSRRQCAPRPSRRRAGASGSRRSACCSRLPVVRVLMPRPSTPCAGRSWTRSSTGSALAGGRARRVPSGRSPGSQRNRPRVAGGRPCSSQSEWSVCAFAG